MIRLVCCSYLTQLRYKIAGKHCSSVNITKFVNKTLGTHKFMYVYLYIFQPPYSGTSLEYHREITSIDFVWHCRRLFNNEKILFFFFLPNIEMKFILWKSYRAPRSTNSSPGFNYNKNKIYFTIGTGIHLFQLNDNYHLISNVNQQLYSNCGGLALTILL